MASQANRGNIIDGWLTNKIWRNGYLRNYVKNKDLLISVISILAYVAETRYDRSLTKHILETNETRILRKNANQTSCDTIGNTDQNGITCK